MTGFVVQGHILALYKATADDMILPVLDSNMKGFFVNELVIYARGVGG